VANHGLVVITRAGSNPGKFIFDSDILTKYQVTKKLPLQFGSPLLISLIISEQHNANHKLGAQ